MVKAILGVFYQDLGACERPGPTGRTNHAAPSDALCGSGGRGAGMGGRASSGRRGALVQTTRQDHAKMGVFLAMSGALHESTLGVRHGKQRKDARAGVPAELQAVWETAAVRGLEAFGCDRATAFNWDSIVRCWRSNRRACRSSTTAACDPEQPKWFASTDCIGTAALVDC